MSAPAETLQVTDTEVIVRDMLTPDRAVDLFLGDLARRGYAERTRTTYRRILDKFLDYLPIAVDVSEIREEDIQRFLDSFIGISPKTRKPYAQGTRVQADAPLRSFFCWLYKTKRLKRNLMEDIDRPQRQHPDDLDVVTVSPADVARMLEAASGWREILALNLLVYTGSRRRAVAWLRLSDYDQRLGQLRFREKGAKTIYKDVPTELAQILDAALAARVIQDGAKYLAAGDPDRSPYLVPPGSSLRRSGDRGDRVIWDVVTGLAKRLGIRCHVHALRAAFACFYADNGLGDLDDLREQMGHRSSDTTLLYLRRRDRDRQRSKVRSLSWRQSQHVPGDSGGLGSGEELLVGAGGFEPPSGDLQVAEPDAADNLLLGLLERIPHPEEAPL